MTNETAQQATPWGGNWTKQKLDILWRYLDAYTTALKDKPFNLIYIDAFAGTGDVRIRTRDQDYEELVAGSPKRALRVSDKPFDRLVFVEKSPQSCNALDCLMSEYTNRNISIKQRDANDYLSRLHLESNWRGVLFIDPFATQLEFSTLEHIARLKKLDTWILFPTMAVQRVLVSKYSEGSYPAHFAAILDRVYGDDNWRNVYRKSPQLSLFSDSPNLMERSPGVESLLEAYRQNLRKLFGRRLLENSRSLKNSQSRDLFELFFCVGHPNGIKPAKCIAKHILENF